MTTNIHNSNTCPCDTCAWANEVESQRPQSRMEAIQQQRDLVLSEISRLEKELNRLDDEYDRLEQSN
jgi:predicted nuclease with TOPRIM domain